jgi:hypothetical protein
LSSRVFAASLLDTAKDQSPEGHPDRPAHVG